MPHKDILLLQTLAATPRKLQQILDNIGGGGEDSPQHGKGTVPKDVLRDFVEYEKRALQQLKRVVEEDNPRLGEIHPWEMQSPGPMKQEDLLAKIQNNRRRTLTFLTQRSSDDWRRPGIDPGQGKITFRQLVIRLVDHDRRTLNRFHLAQRYPQEQNP